MRKFFTSAKTLAFALFAMVNASMVNAQTAAPHSVTATANYNAVTVAWNAPADDIKLKWHNEDDYDAADGTVFNPEDITTFYVSNYFTAEDLKNVVGKSVESVSYIQYREIYRATVFVYVDEEVVAEKVDDQSNFESGEEMIVKLDTPVEIKAGSSMRFAVKFECGSNMNMVASRDAGPAVVGKGDCYSTDGKNWISDNKSNFWVTARLVNDATVEADGYNVYCDNEKLNSELITGTEFVAENQAKGVHNYAVSAVYGGNEVMSYSVPASVNVFPTPSILDVKTELFTNTLTWQAPPLAANTLTWSNQELLNGMGGTGSSPKIWIKNEFEASDLIAYVGAQLTSINIFLYEESSSKINSCQLFVMENDKIVYSEALTADVLALFELGKWNKIELTTPYTIPSGKKVAYGVYVTHTKGKHPISYDTCPTGNIGKGTMYSTSSSKSTFNNSTPTWKDLSEAGMTGNWMLTADVTGATAMTVAGYDLYRNGEKVASNISGNTYSDEVDAPGYYTYDLVAVGSDGATSDAASEIVLVALPDSYRAPYIESATFDSDTKKFELSWSMDAEVKHYNSITYTVPAFGEDMTIMAGTKFTAAELAPYKGYSISRLSGMLYAEIGDIKMGIYTSKGAVIAESTIAAGQYSVGNTIVAELPTAVTITGEEDLYIAYTLDIPGEASPLVIDEGPLVENGAIISLTGGISWMKLGTISSLANNHNIVISALATPPSATPSSKMSVETVRLSPLAKKEIEPAVKSATSAKSALTNAPQVSKFRIYCNNVLEVETSDYNYAKTLKRFGPYTYELSAVYSNGWESARTEQLSFTNGIEQKNPAPFDLKGTASGEDLVLSWSDASDATVMSYEQGDVDNVYQLSGSGSGFYAMIKYSTTDLADKVGMKITHIRFKLATADLLQLEAVVMYGNNVVYSQEVDLDNVVVGYNTVRLDNPVEIPAGWEVGVGYFINGPTKVPMMVMDGGPAVENYSDVYSTSGLSWYSMKKKNSADYNWRISATLETADQEVVKPMDASSTTYNVYRDGEKIASGIAATNYVVANAVEGNYYVTAVVGADESAESNTVKYVDLSSIDDVVANNNAVVYDAANQVIEMRAEGDCQVYTASGVLVKSASCVSSLNISDLTDGIYVANAVIEGVVTTIKIAK